MSTNWPVISSAICRISAGRVAGIVGTHCRASVRVLWLAAARLIPATSLRRACAERRVPSQLGQVCVVTNRLTRARPFSLAAFFIASRTAWRALR
jgi:hypothetical protein